MAMAHYQGVDGVARKVKKRYEGLNGVSRKVTKAFTGVNGVARQYFSTHNFTYEFYTKSPDTSNLTIHNISAGEDGGVWKLRTHFTSGRPLSSGGDRPQAGVVIQGANMSGKKITITSKVDQALTGYNDAIAIWIYTDGGQASGVGGYEYVLNYDDAVNRKYTREITIPDGVESFKLELRCGTQGTFDVTWTITSLLIDDEVIL